VEVLLTYHIFPSISHTFFSKLMLLKSGCSIYFKLIIASEIMTSRERIGPVLCRKELCDCLEEKSLECLCPVKVHNFLS
jgi:hypothetical protein